MLKTFTTFALVLAFSLPGPARAEAVPASQLAVRSTGQTRGDGWLLDANGYVGAYLQLDQRGEVAVTVRAAGTNDGEVTPHMTVSVGDQH